MYGKYDWDDDRMMADLDARDRAFQAQDRLEQTEGHTPMWDRITDETAGLVIEPFDFSPVQVPERKETVMRQVSSSCGTGYDARVRAMRSSGIAVTEHEEQFSGRRTAFVLVEDFEKANEICLRPSLRCKERKINKGWRKR